MAKNLLIRLIKMPQKLYSDYRTIRNERRIRRGQLPWPYKSLYDVIWVDPAEIVGTLYKKDRFPGYCRGQILPGNWDRNFKPIEDTTAYMVLHQRYMEGKEWEEILRNPRLRMGQLDEKQIRKYREKAAMRDAVYQDLKESGWKKSTIKKKSTFLTDELNVNVTRDGSFIRNNSGVHRLVMARFLGLDRIPCHIHVVHSEFVEKIKTETSKKKPDSQHGSNHCNNKHVERQTILFQQKNPLLQRSKTKQVTDLKT